MSAPELDGVRPRDVLLYSTGVAERTVPAVGDAPPAVLPGLSARQLLLVLGVGAAVLFVFAAITTSFLDGVPVMRIVVPVVFLGGGAALAVLAVRVQTRLFAELQHGYTTIRLQFGRTRGDRWRQSTVGGRRLSWDYSGTWFLAPDGSVRAAPRRDLDAPGFYPSPTDPGARELWTGVSWSGRLAA